MILRLEQITAMARQSGQAFEDRLVAMLRHWLPTWSDEMPEAALRRGVRAVARRAMSLGLRRQLDVEHWVLLSAVFGNGFDPDAGNSWRCPPAGDADESLARLFEPLRQTWVRRIQRRNGQGERP